MRPVHPVGHPDGPVVGVHGHRADLHLARIGVPVDGAKVRERPGIVNGDLDIGAAPVDEGLDARIELALVDADVSDVVGLLLQIPERILVDRQALPGLVIGIQRGAAADVIAAAVDGNALAALDLDDPHQFERPEPPARRGCTQRCHQQNPFQAHGDTSPERATV